MRMHAHLRTSGFSMVELLVTVVLAGIVFASMVPLFISAEVKSSGDQMRNIALNLAQDRIEKVRQLDFDQITLANLQSGTGQYSQFGTSWTSYSGGGATKTFSITYTVNNVAANGTNPAYVVVKVVVGWAGQPTPNYTPALQTVITKDYAGPQIISETVGPTNANGVINSTPVTLTARVGAADIASTAKVVFSIFTQSGSVVTTITQTSGSSGVYTATWDASSAANGTYAFQAQAYTAAPASSAGNAWSRRAALQLNSAPPQLPTVHIGTGYHFIGFWWTPSTATDLAYYQVWRSTTSGAETLYYDQMLSPGFNDLNVTVGTTYYYKVCAVDTDGNAGPLSAQLSAAPGTTSGAVPGKPASFAVSRVNDTAVITWAAGTGSPAGYHLFRDGAIYAMPDVSARTFTDTIGYGTVHTYYLMATSAYGYSPATSTLQVNTATPPTYTMTVTVNKSSPASSVNVVQIDSYLTQPYDWSTKSATSSSSAVWTGLPYGTYKVTCAWSGTIQSQTITFNSAKTVPFTF
jgi:type II secretory pathway pseudopilin PulG